jgi:hypothetical protein
MVALNTTRQLQRLAMTIIGLSLLLRAPSLLLAREDAPTEYQVKAAFLLNFAQFIEWPADALPGRDSPFVIGVLGDDPFGEVLEQTFANEAVQDHRVRIVRSNQVEDLRDAQLLFICRSEREHLGEILAAVQNRPIVTVGELADFARRGGIINFYLDGNKVRFELNADAAQHKGLRVSSQLLKRARIVSSSVAEHSR